MINLEGPKPTFTFDIPGVYNVTMKVFDWQGNSNTDYLQVTVIDTIDPVAIIKGPLTVLEGESLSLNGLDSTDNGRIDRYEWTFIDDIEILIIGPYLNYSLIRKGTIDVQLTVFDRWNNSNSAIVTVDVVDTTLPIASAGEDASIIEGSTYIFNGSGSTDNGMIAKWVWSFEYDGQKKNLEGEIVEFKFDIPGDYTITLTVYDQSDNSDHDILTITVNPLDAGDDDIIEDDDTNSDKGSPIIFIVLIVVLLLLFIAIFVWFILLRRKPKDDQMKDEHTESIVDGIGEPLKPGIATRPQISPSDFTEHVSFEDEKDLMDSNDPIYSEAEE
jgi:hypothetical protein